MRPFINGFGRRVLIVEASENAIAFLSSFIGDALLKMWPWARQHPIAQACESALELWQHAQELVQAEVMLELTNRLPRECRS